MIEFKQIIFKIKFELAKEYITILYLYLNVKI